MNSEERVKCMERLRFGNGAYVKDKLCSHTSCSMFFIHSQQLQGLKLKLDGHVRMYLVPSELADELKSCA